MLRKAHYAMAVFFIGLFLAGCSITFSNTYGPYMGKVVDKDSGEPLEEAVVFLMFYTNGFYGVSTFVDAVETLTDSKGEFIIPAQNIRHLQIWAEWEPASVIIFKPGFGAFPMHKGTYINDERKMHIPQNEYATIKLPRLKSREERRRNLFNIPNIGAPQQTYIKLRELEKIERIEAGIDP